MRAIDIAEAAIRAWESKDASRLASLLSNDFVCRGFLPQPVQKVQYLGFMQAIVLGACRRFSEEHQPFGLTLNRHVAPT